MKQWVALCLLTLVALSGCFGDAEDAGTDADDSMDDGMMDDGNVADNATNTAPVVEAFEANRTEGEVPFDVRFDFNASDADGDNLTWTLDADGDGEVETNGTGAVLPFNFTFTFDTAGTYNATLNVTDGSNSTSAVVTITASEPEEEENEGEGEEGGEEEPQVEDRGWYEYDPATGYCHVKEYTGEGVYVFDGTWFAVESNLVSGLQVANNHPGGASFNHPDVGDDCQDGDQLII